MFYKLNSGIAIRSWIGVPYSYYSNEENSVGVLTKEEYDLLLKCNGKFDIDYNNFVQRLMKLDLITTCKENDDIDNWQKPFHYNNHYFSSMFLSITGKCNYNCKHCYMAADNYKNQNELTFEECIKILDSCVKCGIYSIQLTGGEPMLHPHFMDVIRECVKRHIKITEILTNGSFITEEMLDEFIRLKIKPTIKVSFDGIGCHDWMRGVNGAEKSALNAINLICSKGLKSYVQMCIHHGNLKSVDATIKKLNEMGVKTLRIIPTTESPRWEVQGKYLILSVEEYYNKALEISKKYIKSNYTMNLDFWRFLKIFPAEKSYYCVPVKRLDNLEHEKSYICNTARFCVSVSNTGDILPCDRITGYLKNMNINFGNIKNDNLQQILLDSEYFDLVKCNVKTFFEKSTKCGKCKFKDKCFGGCRAKAFIIGKNLLGEDFSNCLYFKGGYLEKTCEMFNDLKKSDNIYYKSINL